MRTNIVVGCAELLRVGIRIWLGAIHCIVVGVGGVKEFLGIVDDRLVMLSITFKAYVGCLTVPQRDHSAVFHARVTSLDVRYDARKCLGLCCKLVDICDQLLSVQCTFLYWTGGDSKGLSQEASTGNGREGHVC